MEGEHADFQLKEVHPNYSQEIIQVFGNHAGGKRYQQQMENFEAQLDLGIFPEKGITWREPIPQQIKRLNPSLIAFDGTTSSDDNLELGVNPGDPFAYRTEDPTGKDTFLVGADLPFYFHDYLKTVFLFATKNSQNLQEAIGRDIQMSKEDLALSKKLGESALLAMLYGISFLPIASAASAGLALALASIEGTRVLLNRLLHMRGFGNNLPFVVSRLTTPIMFQDKEIAFRNALIAAKTRDMREKLGKRANNGPMVNVLGTAHAIGKNVWKNEASGDKVIQRRFRKMFQTMQALHNSSEQTERSLSSSDIAHLVYDMVTVFGEVAAWKIGERPQETPVSTESARKALPLEERFYSPAIIRLANQAAVKVFKNYNPQEYDRLYSQI